MNSRQRFLETMRFGNPDHVPYFQEGIRDEVFRIWAKQGLLSKTELLKKYPIDGREELEIDGYPHPHVSQWPSSLGDFSNFQKSLRATESRLPNGWRRKIDLWNTRQETLMLEVHHGFFLTLGVNDWKRFNRVVESLIDDPQVVFKVMQIEAEMVRELLNRFLTEVEIDAVIFSEPIGGNYGSLISPIMYEKYVLTSYRPILEVLALHKVDIIILRTYANARALIPSMLKFGFNCLWACETNAEAMDYRSIRSEFSRDLRLIGGIDLDILREGKEAIRREIMEKAPPLLEQGGYVPLADGRVRSDIPLENYLFYRELLAQITQGKTN